MKVPFGRVLGTTLGRLWSQSPKNVNTNSCLDLNFGSIWGAGLLNVGRLFVKVFFVNPSLELLFTNVFVSKFIALFSYQTFDPDNAESYIF